jgi:DNA-binding NtrC family response regulator
MRDLRDVEDLVRQGRFTEALATAGSRSSEASTLALRADLLLQIGKAEDSLWLARRLLGIRLDASVAARCHTVLGNCFRNSGELQQACEHYQKSVLFSERAQDPGLACWAHLKLMATTAEGRGGDLAFATVSAVRRRVAALGDPHATSALHIFLAEIETKRGFIDNAVRHIRIADAILGCHPNHWLQGLNAIAAFAVCYSNSRLGLARAHALEALRFADVSGHAVTRMAAASDLGHVHLLWGQLMQAERWLRSALRGWHQGGGAATAIMDGLAQVHLARGDVRACEEALALAPIQIDNPEELSYYEAWTIPTRVRLLLRQGRAEAAGRLAAIGARIAAERTSPSLVNRLQLLQSEAILSTGAASEAAEIVCRAAAAPEGVEPMEASPRVGRMMGRLHAAAGDRAAAGVWFERAARVLAIAGNECARAEVLSDCADTLLGPCPGAPFTAEEGDLATRTPINSVTIHPRAATQLGPPAAVATPSPLSTLESAAAVIDFARSPQCVGYEVHDLLRQCDAVTNAAILVRPRGRNPEVVFLTGDYRSARKLLHAAAGVERIPLGRWSEQDVELAVEPRGDLGSRAAIAATTRLTRAALALETAERERRERAALWPLNEAAEARHGIFASQTMIDLLATARKVAQAGVIVLITGETGTGKEVFARIIHDASARAAKPFVPFNCSAVPREMLDSQLFGYRKGSFTGAAMNFPGVIRNAAGGTIFLDEIGEVSPDLQPKLLRFLEEREIQPLGEPRPISVDVRVLAATNADLEQLVASGRFREDLYYRLNVIRLHIPPLRERREEIPVLAQHFLRRFAEEYRKDNLRLAEETMEYLLLYSWPGNVRQLLNQMRRLAALAESGAVLMPEHLPHEIAATRRTIPPSERDLAPTEVVVRVDQPLAAAIEHIERAMVPHALKAAGGRLEVAAKMLGVSRKGLYLKRRRLGLDPDQPAAS